MARIQVLPLPDVVEGNVARTPFVLVIDQVGADTESINTPTGTVRTISDVELIDTDSIKAATGAAGVIVAAMTMDVVTRT